VFKCVFKHTSLRSLVTVSCDGDRWHAMCRRWRVWGESAGALCRWPRHLYQYTRCISLSDDQLSCWLRSGAASSQLYCSPSQVCESSAFWCLRQQ